MQSAIFSTNTGLHIVIDDQINYTEYFKIPKVLLDFTPLFSPADILQIKMSSDIVFTCFDVSIFISSLHRPTLLGNSRNPFVPPHPPTPPPPVWFLLTVQDN